MPLRLFLVLFSFISVILGCGSIAIFVEDLVREQASFNQAQKYVQSHWEKIRLLDRKGGYCRIGVSFWPDNYIVRTESDASKSGLRRGDRLIRLNGDAGEEWQKHLPLIAKHRPNEQLTLTLLRSGTEVERKIRCEDGRPFSELWIAALQAASQQRWRQCANFSYELENLSRFSEFSLLRHHCSEADRVSSYQMPTESDARILFDARLQQLEEARYVPDGANKIREEVLEAIYWMERNHFRDLAAALREQLKKTSSPEKPK
ncbi:MAG: serine protease [Deltaproteobacteria bacterium]|nr:serine protease [Deltaproteobacteria bacterium]